MIEDDATVDDNDFENVGMMAGWLPVKWIDTPATFDMSSEEAKAIIEEEVQDLQERQHQLENRVSELSSTRKTVAYVQVDKCAGCGLCMDVCPVSVFDFLILVLCKCVKSYTKGPMWPFYGLLADRFCTCLAEKPRPMVL